MQEKKEKPSKVRVQGFDELFKTLEKEFGPDTGRPITDRSYQKVARFSSGLLMLDDMLGGGIPKGRIVEVFGHESSGKTSICLKMIAAAQAQGLVTAFIDAEHTLDMLWAEKLGVNIPTMLFEQPMSGEKALDIVKALVMSGKVDLIVVDSVAALTPLAEAAGEIGEAHIGRLARLMSQAMRILVPQAAKHGTTIVFTNQIRMNIGVMFGNPETTPGGNALRFFSSARINVSRKKFMEGTERTGDTITMKLIKSKVSRPYQQADITLVYDEGFNTNQELLDLAIKYEILTKNGTWYSYGDTRIGQGEAQVLSWLEGNKDKASAIATKVLASLSAP